MSNSRHNLWESGDSRIRKTVTGTLNFYRLCWSEPVLRMRLDCSALRSLFAAIWLGLWWPGEYWVSWVQNHTRERNWLPRWGPYNPPPLWHSKVTDMVAESSPWSTCIQYLKLCLLVPILSHHHITLLGPAIFVMSVLSGTTRITGFCGSFAVVCSCCYANEVAKRALI